MKNSKKKLKKKTKTTRAHWRSIISLILIFSGAFLLLSQISYMYNWKKDFNTLDWDPSSEPAANIFGKLGAFLGHITIYQGFGVATVLLALMLLFTGIWILQKKHWLRIIVNWIWTLFLTVFISWFFALIKPDHLLLSGIGGLEAGKISMFYIGKWGALALWFLIAVLFLIYKFKLEPEFLNKMIGKITAPAAKIKSPDAFFKRKSKSHTTSDHPEEQNLQMQINRSEEEIEVEEKILDSEPKPIPEKEEINRSENKQNVDNQQDDDFEIIVTEEELVDKPNEILEEFGEFDPTLELSDYQYPHFDLLKDYSNVEVALDERELVENKDKIVKTLKDFGIGITKIEATVGPSVTLYEIVQEPGIRISKIKNLADDIAMSLEALGIRMIAPMPGRGTIGIEVPNKNPVLVPLKRVLMTKKFQQSKMELPIAIGKTISNETFVFDLVKMPHLLIAGATGQGKSVGLNVIINSMLFKKHPAELKFVMVDPKRVELSLYNAIEKHFLAKLPGEADAIINDVTKVKETLNSLVKEMESRYRLMEKAKVRNIVEYNQKFKQRRLNPQNGHRFLPYIVLVIDEFGDFIMTAGKEVEMPIALLAQKARAVGIHLIIATQRPSVNIITGTIKANFPARIAFRVASQIDSRTILDQSGAEKLIGKGDMLIRTPGSDLIRLQCAFIDTDEVENVTEFIGAQRGYPEAYRLPEPDTTDSILDDDDEAERDALFKEAAYIIVSAQQGSASLLQRKLKIGYNRAGRLIDQMEKAGIVGPSQGSKPRDVYITSITELEKFFDGI